MKSFPRPRLFRKVTYLTVWQPLGPSPEHQYSPAVIFRSPRVFCTTSLFAENVRRRLRRFQTAFGASHAERVASSHRKASPFSPSACPWPCQDAPVVSHSSHQKTRHTIGYAGPEGAPLSDFMGTVLRLDLRCAGRIDPA